MVKHVGLAWECLSSRYRLSWSDQRTTLLPLLDKASLEAHCDRLSLPYPKSLVIETIEDIKRVGDKLPFPLIAKPTLPLSGFKVRLIESEDDLLVLASRYPHALPFLLQQWIPGGDESLYFTAFYLDNGRILACYEGQKLGSNPPAMGQTTIARSCPNPVVRAIAERFFEPLKLSGPVSLEVKVDQAGQPWIIEPTLGRTDYWVDCCVANDVNLPAIEFAHQSGKPVPNSIQTNNMIWFDTERSPLCYLRFRLGAGHRIAGPWQARFPYWGHADPLPFIQGLQRLAGNYSGRAWRKLFRS